MLSTNTVELPLVSLLVETSKYGQPSCPDGPTRVHLHGRISRGYFGDKIFITRRWYDRQKNECFYIQRIGIYTLVDFFDPLWPHRVVNLTRFSLLILNVLLEKKLDADVTEIGIISN